jgi:transposase
MDPSRYAVDAVIIESRSYRSVATSIDMSKSWVAKQVSLDRQGGYDALGKRSIAPLRRPTRVSDACEEEIISWRKHLEDEGRDAGLITISTTSHKLALRAQASPRSTGCCVAGAM